MKPHLIGCHLHDVIYPAKDHRVPFVGELDYDILLKHFSTDKPIVWEISHSQEKSAVLEALQKWKKKFPQFC